MSQSELKPQPMSLNIKFADASNLPVSHVNAISVQSGTDEFFFTVGVVTPPSNEYLSSEDREAREKGLQLAARIEHLYQTDEEFQCWYQEGMDEIEAGHFVTFSEDGWQEE